MFSSLKVHAALGVALTSTSTALYYHGRSIHALITAPNGECQSISVVGILATGTYSLYGTEKIHQLWKAEGSLLAKRSAMLYGVGMMSYFAYDVVKPKLPPP
jgi:hypothetical protein